MARRMRQSNFPQLGGQGTQYQVTERATGAPKLNERGNPKMSWKYPTMPTFKDPHEHAAAVANVVHSIVNASPEQVKFGMNWYPAAHDIARAGSRKRGFLSGQADKTLAGAAILASVSPNSDWDRNNSHALREIGSLKSHHWDLINSAQEGTSRSALRSQAAVRQSLSGMSIGTVATKNLQKAGRIVHGEDPNQVISAASAPKTHSFMHNIADPANPGFVTIDGRAFDTMTNRLRPWDVGRGIGGSTTNKSMPSRYTASAGIFQGIASDMGIHPSAAQATSWAHVKYDLEMSGGARKQGPSRVGQPYFHPETGEPALHMGRQFG